MLTENTNSFEWNNRKSPMMEIWIFIAFMSITIGFCSCDYNVKYCAKKYTINEYNLPTDSIKIRDPSILYDSISRAYYMYASNKHGIKVYKSTDLKNWEDLGNCFTATKDFWGKEDFWAPDVYWYKGKYYLFATFSGSDKKRGVGILVSESPYTDFQPLISQSITPKEWMSLDGSLHVDKNNNPWIIFSREWLDVTDGQVVAQQLSMDLKSVVGEPIVLFKSKDAKWTKEISYADHNGYVTDAPFIYNGEDGKLIMLWSSFDKSGKYAIGIAKSSSDNIIGSWVQSQLPINSDDGGHAMLFHSNGKLMISYHSPNTGTERVKIREVLYKNGVIMFKD